MLVLAAVASHVVEASREPVAPHGKGLTARAVQVGANADGAPVVERLAADVHLAYRDFGPRDAPALVLLHGSPGDGGHLADLGRALEDRWRVVIPDLPGFGRSSVDAPDLSIRAHADYVLQLLDGLHIERAHLLGFSMGGGPALHAWEAAPERVASLILLASVGVQEMEWLGDHHLNHAMHAAQLRALQALDLAVPDFGSLDFDRAIAYARNFHESDQRPLRELLARFEPPTLIVHGERDPLVHVAAAREHLRLVPQSELLLLVDEEPADTPRPPAPPGVTRVPSPRPDHFLVFRAEQVAWLAERVDGFLRRVEDGQAPTRARADPARVTAAARPFDPADIPVAQGAWLVLLMTLLAAATLVSEDLSCIGAGLMASQGRISFVAAAAACVLGIFVGDMLLFLAGRVFGRPAVRRAPLRWMIREEALERGRRWFERKGPAVIFLSRFTPGMRLPTYVAAGVLGKSPLWFAGWFLLASLAWTPLLVGLSMVAGATLLEAFSWVEDNALLVGLAVVLCLLAIIKLAVPMATHAGRRRLVGAWMRWTQWEFWPPWLFYPPLVVWIAWLALKHRSLSVVTATNPAIPASGILGESKWDILQGLAPHAGDALPPAVRLPATESLAARRERLHAWMRAHDLELPVVLKPDQGQRGLDVTVVRTADAIDPLLAAARGDLIAQSFVPGEEFGVFWVRDPDTDAGRVISVTAKELPRVTGDGARTLAQLVLDDPRAVALWRSYLADRFDADELVPAAGESVPLTDLGTHCRGAVFLDACELITPELTAAIDALARPYEGFWFGRFDLRAPSASALKRGEGLRILELNGLTSEATHVYDARHSVLYAWRTLAAQWELAFRIARRNVAAGAPVTSVWEVVRMALGFVRGRRRGAVEP